MSSSDAIALISAAVGAFLGSGLAFLLEENRRRRAERDTRYSSLIQTQLALGMQINTLVIIQKRYLDEYRGKNDRHMKMLPVQMSFTDVRINLGFIGFLAEVDDVGILQRVYLAEQAYVNATATLTTCNLKIQEIRYNLAIARGPVNPQTGEATAFFDPAHVVVLKQLIDGLYSSVDGAIVDQRKALEELAAAIKRLYPKRKVLGVKISETGTPG
jgi:hypothetical protein